MKLQANAKRTFTDLKMPEITPKTADRHTDIQGVTFTSWHRSSVDGKLYVSHHGLSVSS